MILSQELPKQWGGGRGAALCWQVFPLEVWWFPWSSWAVSHLAAKCSEGSSGRCSPSTTVNPTENQLGRQSHGGAVLPDEGQMKALGQIGVFPPDPILKRWELPLASSYNLYTPRHAPRETSSNIHSAKLLVWPDVETVDRVWWMCFLFGFWFSFFLFRSIYNSENVDFQLGYCKYYTCCLKEIHITFFAICIILNYSDSRSSWNLGELFSQEGLPGLGFQGPHFWNWGGGRREFWPGRALGYCVVMVLCISHPTSLCSDSWSRGNSKNNFLKCLAIYYKRESKNLKSFRNSWTAELIQNPPLSNKSNNSSIHLIKTKGSHRSENSLEMVKK